MEVVLLYLIRVTTSSDHSLGLNPSNRKSLASLAGRLVRLYTLRPNLPSFPQRTEGCLTAGSKFTWLAYAKVDPMIKTA